MDPVARESLLYDFYGNLLTEKKRKVMELYHEENLSLSEIAEEFGVSRTAVHDSLKSAEKQLENFETRLGLLDRMNRDNLIIDGVISDIGRLAEDACSDCGDAIESIRDRLQDLKR